MWSESTFDERAVTWIRVHGKIILAMMILDAQVPVPESQGTVLPLYHPDNAEDIIEVYCQVRSLVWCL